MKVTVNHNLSQEKLLECSKNLLDNLRKEHGDNISNIVQLWTGYNCKFSFRIKGLAISGTITVNEHDVIVDGKLPVAAMLFKGMIEDTIKKHTEEMINNCATTHKS